MTTPPTITTPCTTPGRMRLMRLMNRIAFGRIEKLCIAAGEPQFSPAPVIVTELKFGADQQVKDRAVTANPHPAMRDLMRTLDAIDTGCIRCLDIRHGLPFRIEMDGDLTE